MSRSKRSTVEIRFITLTAGTEPRDNVSETRVALSPAFSLVLGVGGNDETAVTI